MPMIAGRNPLPEQACIWKTSYFLPWIKRRKTDLYGVVFDIDLLQLQAIVFSLKEKQQGKGFDGKDAQSDTQSAPQNDPQKNRSFTRREERNRGEYRELSQSVE